VKYHTNDLICLLCAEKLATADPRIAEWFLEIKKEFPHAHVSWAYRNKEDQDRFFAEGKTRAKFPRSKHNVERDGKPYAQALDLFELRNGDCDASSKTPVTIGWE
jgi:hypothetical protein